MNQRHDTPCDPEIQRAWEPWEPWDLCCVVALSLCRTPPDAVEAYACTAQRGEPSEWRVGPPNTVQGAGVGDARAAKGYCAWLPNKRCSPLHASVGERSSGPPSRMRRPLVRPGQRTAYTADRGNVGSLRPLHPALSTPRPKRPRPLPRGQSRARTRQTHAVAGRPGFLRVLHLSDQRSGRELGGGGWPCLRCILCLALCATLWMGCCSGRTQGGVLFGGEVIVCVWYCRGQLPGPM